VKPCIGDVTGLVAVHDAGVVRRDLQRGNNVVVCGRIAGRAVTDPIGALLYELDVQQRKRPRPSQLEVQRCAVGHFFRTCSDCLRLRRCVELGVFDVRFVLHRGHRNSVGRRPDILPMLMPSAFTTWAVAAPKRQRLSKDFPQYISSLFVAMPTAVGGD
jgi:hypothetical protein